MEPILGYIELAAVLAKKKLKKFHHFGFDQKNSNKNCILSLNTTMFLWYTDDSLPVHVTQCFLVTPQCISTLVH